MNWPGEPCLLEGVSADDYHQDRFGDVPTLRRSVAHTGIIVDWLHAAAEHPRLPGTVVAKQSKSMDLGSLVHCLLLGGEEGLVVLPAKYSDFRTDAARALRDGAYEEGKVPILAEAYEEAATACEILKPEICRAIEAVFGFVSVSVLWSEFGRELTCLWEEEAATVDEMVNIHHVRCRARFDLYWPPAALLADLKVVTSGYASASKFIRGLNSEEDSGAMQAGSYLRGLEACHPELAGRTTFVFLRVEPYPPHSVVAIPVGRGMRELGERRWLRGVAGWAECMASGVWPGPSPVVAEVETWAVERELRHQMEGADDAG